MKYRGKKEDNKLWSMNSSQQYRSYMYKRGILRGRNKSEILLPLYPTVSSSIRCGYLEGTSVGDAVHRALITREELSITERARARASFVLYAHHPHVARFAIKIMQPADVVEQCRSDNRLPSRRRYVLTPWDSIMRAKQFEYSGYR